MEDIIKQPEYPCFDISNGDSDVYLFSPMPNDLIYRMDQAVIDEVFVSEKSELSDDASKKFLEKTNVKSINAANLKDFYEAIINIIYQQRLIKIIGDYPDKVINALKVKEALKELEMHQAELNKFKEQAASLQTMRSKMENHMSQKNVEKHIDSIIQSIKEAL